MHRIQVVEPTLETYSGHCHSQVSSFCRAASGTRIDLWSAKGSEKLDFGPGVAVHPWFRRRIRLLQTFFLLRRLLPEPAPIVLLTARRSDLALIRLAAGGPLPPRRVFLYFHWFRETPGKSRFLRKIAARLPNLVILGTTESVVEVFRRCGFANVFLLPLPYATTQPARAANAVPFRQLLYAGAARHDKGFTQVVDLVELLARRKESIPVTLQVSADHYGKYDPATRADLARLQSVVYPPLKLVGETLSPQEYAGLFPGSICLQPYRRADFADRVSGVTMDALSQGCPVITTSRTWMAALISRSGAGLALDDISAEGLHGAIGAVLGRYASYQAAARAAGLAQDRNSWAPLIDLLDQ